MTLGEMNHINFDWFAPKNARRQTEDEVRASALQFVRKLSGCTQPSRTNEAAFNEAVDKVAAAAQALLAGLVTTSPPRDRAVEAMRAKARSQLRFG